MDTRQITKSLKSKENKIKVCELYLKNLEGTKHLKQCKQI